MRYFKTVLGLSLALLMSGYLFAQTSTNYKLEEHALNAGGNPEQGAVLSSSNYKLSIDALGDSVASAATSSSTNYQTEAGFVPPYPPPGEVLNVAFSGLSTLNWDPEVAVGDYSLYRGLMSSLSGLAYGACEQSGLTATTATEAASPPAGDGYFYLITARNRLRESGTKGDDSTASQRPNASPCP